MTKDDDLLRGFLQHTMMEETKAYMHRGRQHEALQSRELNDRWVAAFRDWFKHRKPKHIITMDDLSAELRLRRKEPPYARIAGEIVAMQFEMRALHSESALDSLRSKMFDFQIQKSKRVN
jgi:hypothetical protein